ncbi:MAG: DUF5399 family protein [Chlamydia sp.]
MPAVTIDRLDIGIYIQYARRTQLIEQVQQQYNLKEAGSIPAQALIVDFYPKLSELDLLLGVGTTLAPWAYFFAPLSYKAQRFSPFAFHRVLPSLEEEEDEQEALLSSFTCEDPEEEIERNILLDCIQRVKELNELMRYISGRIGQFLQG